MYVPGSADRSVIQGKSSSLAVVCTLVATAGKNTSSYTSAVPVRKCDGQKPAMCNCEECTDDVLDLETSKGGTCFERMKDTWDALGVTEDDACLIVSEDLPRECGPKCHPVKCDGKAPAYCSCNECTDFDLDLVADGFTCYERIQAHQDEDGFNENDACRAVGTFFPEICGPKCHPGKILASRDCSVESGHG